MLLKVAFGVALLFFVAESDDADCANEYKQYYECVDKKFEEHTDKISTPIDAKHISTDASACFTSNGCKAPPDVSKEPAADEKPSNAQDDEDDDSGDMFSIGYEAIQIKKILNPAWFPKASSRNVSATDEECVAQKDNLAMGMIEKCVQKTFANFKFPTESGLPTKMDYIESTSEMFSSLDEVFDDAAYTYIASLRDGSNCPADKSAKVQQCLSELYNSKQPTSFERSLATERVFKHLCTAGTECLKLLKPACKKWVTDSKKVSCDCAQSEKEAIITALVENYGKCFNTETNRDIIAKTYSKIVKKQCHELDEDAKQCGLILGVSA